MWSDMFRADFGVRQGSVLSPFLFTVYLNDLATLCNRKINVFIILSADDILLLAPSVCELDNLFKICECELNLLDMANILVFIYCSHVHLNVHYQIQKSILSLGRCYIWKDWPHRIRGCKFAVERANVYYMVLMHAL